MWLLSLKPETGGDLRFQIHRHSWCHIQFRMLKADVCVGIPVSSDHDLEKYLWSPKPGDKNTSSLWCRFDFQVIYYH